MVHKIPHMETRYELLVKSGLKVFNTDDLVALWKTENRRDALESIKGYVNRGKMFNPFKGIYTFALNYEALELAQKLYPPSYITYYTALAKHGLIFQQYKEIHLFGNKTKKFEINGEEYLFHKVKEEILLNEEGIIQENNYSIASPERAVCDSLYLNNNIAFDNLRNIDVQKMLKIGKLYSNKRLEKDIEKLIKQIENE